MKGVLDLLRRSAPEGGKPEPQDSMLFTTAFADQGVDPSMLVPWEARANEIGTASHHQIAAIAHSDSTRSVSGVRNEIGPILLRRRRPHDPQPTRKDIRTY